MYTYELKHVLSAVIKNARRVIENDNELFMEFG